MTPVVKPYDIGLHSTDFTLRYANRDDDARSCPWHSSSRIWYIPIAPIAFRTCFGKLQTGQENTTVENRQTQGEKTSKQYMRQSISLFRKVMISLLTDPGQTSCFAQLTMLPSLAAATSSLIPRTSCCLSSRYSGFIRPCTVRGRPSQRSGFL